MKKTRNPQQQTFGGIYARNSRIVGLFGYVRVHRRARLKPNTVIVGGMKAYFRRRAEIEREQKKFPMSLMRRGSPLPRHGFAK